VRIPIQVLIYSVRKTRYDWEYLMLKRFNNRGGFWQGVTGAPENSETLSETAKRELYEETGYSPLNLIKTDISYIIPMEDRWKDIYPKGTNFLRTYERTRALFYYLPMIVDSLPLRRNTISNRYVQ